MAVLQPGNGLVEVQDGTGSWISASSELSLSAGQNLRTGPLSAAAIAFSDGSRVTLGPETELAIDELDVGSQERVIILFQSSGESEHDVASASGSHSRYEVRAPNGSAEALGTRFQVLVTPDKATLFSVEQGALAVSGQNSRVTVESGQAALVSAGEAPSEPAMRISGEGAVSRIGETWVIAGQAFTIHEHTLIIGNPQIGDLVHVEGRLLADDTRVADLIYLLRSSPANHFSLTGEVQEKGETIWTIAGQSVAITTTTQIDPGITKGDLVRVEGTILESGSLQADRILSLDDEAGLPFEFTGVVDAIGSSTWVISHVTIKIDEDTVIEGNIEPGNVVQVRGRILPDGTWLAHHIQPAAEGERAFEISGHVDSIDPWRVAGINLETRQWTEIEPGLKVGDLVRVEGVIQPDGTWVAYQIAGIRELPNPLIVIIGTVISVDPWVVNGIPLNVTPETIIVGEITPGMLVRVEIALLPDGTWQVLRITSLDVFIGIPGCMNLTATVISLQGDRLQLLGWPVLILGEDVKIDGDLVPNSVIIIQICFDAEGNFTIIQIIVIVIPEYDFEPPVIGDKVTICHKPDKKKGGNTITVSSSALPAHLGHGDYIGSCSR